MKQLLLISVLLLAACGHQVDPAQVVSEVTCPYPEDVTYIHGRGVCHVAYATAPMPTHCDAPLKLVCDAIWCWCK